MGHYAAAQFARESDRTAEAVKQAVLAERERCAKIAENTPKTQQYCVGRDNLTVDDATATKKAIAAQIRSGK